MINVCSREMGFEPSIGTACSLLTDSACAEVCDLYGIAVVGVVGKWFAVLQQIGHP